MENCPVHGKPFRDGKFGKYCPNKNADGSWCKEKPQQRNQEQQPGGWSGVREQIAAKEVAPEKAVMTKGDWEAKDARRSSEILLQVAFKAAVELIASGHFKYVGKPEPSDVEVIENLTLHWHTWLLSQTEGQKPHSVAIYASDGDIEAANQAIAEAKARDKDGRKEVDGSELLY